MVDFEGNRQNNPFALAPGPFIQHLQREFLLKDFVGNWVLNISTVGGIAGPTAIGSSSVIQGQVTINPKGNGSFNFISGIIYEGSQGVATKFKIITETATLKLRLTDRINGIGNLTISIPSIKYSETADFIAFRSRANAIPLKLQGHGTKIQSTTSSISQFVMERQNL